MKFGPSLVMTPDMDEAAAFYGNLLGLEMTSQSERQLEFRVGAGTLHVFKCARPASHVPHGEVAASVLSFEVDDIEVEMALLRSKGLRFVHDSPAFNALAGLLYAAFLAPGGNVHELVQRVP